MNKYRFMPSTPAFHILLLVESERPFQPPHQPAREKQKQVQSAASSSQAQLSNTTPLKATERNKICKKRKKKVPAAPALALLMSQVHAIIDTRRASPFEVHPCKQKKAKKKSRVPVRVPLTSFMVTRFSTQPT